MPAHEVMHHSVVRAENASHSQRQLPTESRAREHKVTQDTRHTESIQSLSHRGKMHLHRTSLAICVSRTSAAKKRILGNWDMVVKEWPALVGRGLVVQLHCFLCNVLASRIFT